MHRRAALRELLTAHEPIDPVERGHLERMVELIDGEADPFSRDLFVPGHFTASAFVVSPDGLLMVSHRRLQKWLQPGGHIDPEDLDACEAALRETLEETGVTGDGCSLLDVDVHQIPASAREPAHEHFDVRFAIRPLVLDIVAADEVADARWVALSDVHSMGTDESVMRALRKLDRPIAR